MRFSILLTASLMVVFAGTPRTQSHDVRLRAAQQKETVDGDLRAAIALYRQLADDRTTPPEIAAKAVVQIGRCYERLGNSELSEARKAYERVVAQYAGQSASVAEAKTRLAALASKPTTPAAETVAVRRVRGIDGILSSTISQDGRVAAVLQGPMLYTRSRIDMVDLETGRSEPLTIAGAVDGMPALAVSPDARFVAIGVGAGAGPSELRLVDRKAQQVRTVMPSSTAARLIPADWSRDGRSILLIAEHEGTLHIVDVETTKVRDVDGVRYGHAARFSPDGKFIAYSVMAGMAMQPAHVTDAVYVTSVAGGRSELIAEQERVALGGWSEDGKYVLFVAPNVDGDQLWGTRVDAGRRSGRPVSLAKGLPRAFSYHGVRSDSMMMLGPGQMKIYTAAIDPESGATQPREQLIGKVDGLFFSPAYSPDGTQLAYLVSPERGTDRPTALYVRDLRSATERRLGTFVRIGGLSWTPDGSSLLTSIVTDVGTRIVRISVADGRSEDLLAPEGPDRWNLRPRATRDGQTLYYLAAKLGQGTSQTVDLIRYDLATRTGMAIATAVDAIFDLSPDERHLVIKHRDSSAPLLTIITPDGQRVREIARSDPGHQITSMTWAPDGKWIYFVRSAEEGYTVHRTPAAGGPSVFTGVQLKRNTSDLVIHPDGRKMTFISMTERELWRLDNIRLPAAPTAAGR